ncbi:MAG: serine hydrolase [Candidatus Latescibacterota bacterium]
MKTIISKASISAAVFFIALAAVPLSAQQTVTEKCAPSRDYWPTEGWKASTPEKQGMNSVQLGNLERLFSQNFPSSYSLLVIRHGYIVKEAYYNGMDENRSNNIYSITKSFISALTGICIKEGFIKSVNQKMLGFYPEFITADLDTAKKGITIAHMLTHTSGLSGGGGDDWLKNTVESRLASKPGEVFSYSNSVPDLLSGIITKKTGMNTHEFAKKKLFGPLGISVEKWETTPQGIYMGANGMYMTHRELAKLGYLYLNYGCWDGNQILPSDWVRESSSIHASFDRQKAYGYLMWVRQNQDTFNDKKIHSYYFYGHMGQYVGIFPELDLLVVMSADIKDTRRDTFFVMDLIHDFVQMHVFPAITDSK